MLPLIRCLVVLKRLANRAITSRVPSRHHMLPKGSHQAAPRDLDLLTIGLVNDMYAENSNDDYKGYKEVATQEDFDKF